MSVPINRFVPEVSYEGYGDYRVKLEIDGFNIGMRKETHYKETEKFVKLVKQVYVLEDAIGRIAKTASKAEFTSTNASDKVVQKLNNPNAKQSKEEYLKEFSTFLKASGWVVVWKRYEAFGIIDSLQLINLDPDCTDFMTNGDIVTTYDNKEEKISFRDCIVFYDSVRLKNGKGYSKITPLKQQVNNAIIAQIAIGIQIKNSGTTIVSPKAQPAGANAGISEGLNALVHTDQKGGVIPTQGSVIENKLYSHEIENRLIVSATGLDATNLSQALNNFDFNSTVEPAILAIYSAFGVAIELTPYGKNATYENKQVAELSLLENEVIPIVNSLVNVLNQEFKGKAVAEFNHLNAMSIVHKRTQESNGTTITQVKDMVDAQLITVEQGQKMLTDKGIIV